MRGFGHAGLFAVCLIFLVVTSAVIARAGEDGAAALAARGEWRSLIEVDGRTPSGGEGIASRQGEAPDLGQLRRLDLLVYAYLQTGQDDKAKAALASLPRQHSAGGDIAADMLLQTMPLRYALERDDWSAAASEPVIPSPFPGVRALGHFGRALGAARSGALAVARTEAAELEKLRTELRAKGDLAGAARAESELKAVEAWIALAEGRGSDALRLMQAAAARDDEDGDGVLLELALLPMRELLGDLLFDMNEAAAALVQYEASLQRAPARLRGLWGAGQAAEKAGDLAKSKIYYGKFVGLCHIGDCQRPGLLLAFKRQ